MWLSHTTFWAMINRIFESFLNTCHPMAAVHVAGQPTGAAVKAAMVEEKR